MSTNNAMTQFAISLAKKAGKEIKKHFNHDRIVRVKSKSQIVTQADLISDKIIRNAIQKKFPLHSILTEESGTLDNHSPYRWVIDPLDGSTNYSIGNPLFAVSISLFYYNEPIIGVIYAPILDELYVAEKNHGATLNGKKIHVSKTHRIAESFLTYCHGSTTTHIKRGMKVYNAIKLQCLDSRQLGSAALELGFVAAGRTDAIVIPGANSWDVGAGVLLVHEAGGLVTDFYNQVWNFNTKDMVASNKRIHQPLLRLLKGI